MNRHILQGRKSLKPGLKAILVFAFLCFIPCIESLTVYGESQKMKATEMYASWRESGWPDDVGGFYVSEDRFVISLVNMNNDRINELKSGLSNPDEVAFVECDFSYNQLSDVFQHLDEQVWVDENVRTLGIDLEENCVKLGVDPSVVDEYRNVYNKNYGDMVLVYEQGPIVAVDESSNLNRMVICIVIVLFSLIVVTLAVFWIMRIRSKRDVMS